MLRPRCYKEILFNTKDKRFSAQDITLTDIILILLIFTVGVGVAVPLALIFIGGIFMSITYILINCIIKRFRNYK